MHNIGKNIGSAAAVVEEIDSQINSYRNRRTSKNSQAGI